MGGPSSLWVLCVHESCRGARAADKVRDELEAEGRAVFTERQNHFTLEGGSGVKLGGQPDLVATRGPMGLIVDAKTGRPRPSDHVQVLIYMWALPLVLPQYKGMEFSGRVVYRNGHIMNIPASAVDDDFKNNPMPRRRC